MNVTYFAIVHHDQGSSYGVQFPDLPGCFSAADRLEDLERLSREALALHLEGLIESGDEAPAVSSPESIAKLKEARGGFLLAVTAEAPGKAIRINVTLPESTLRRLDSYAAKRGGNRSALLARGAELLMQRK